MPKRMSRKGFLKLFAFIPVAFAMPKVQEMSGFPVEIQIEDTRYFRPDGFYGACPDPDNDWIFRLHYVRDDVEHLEFYRYGVWVVGDSGLPRVVVMDLL